MSQEIQNYFKDNKYVVIKNFLSPEICTILYQYTLLKTQREDHRYTNYRETYFEKWEGTWEDPQAYGAYSLYGDPLMDGLLKLSTESLNTYTGLSLLPQYSYWRLYQKGDVLARHRDRDSCEISTTLCLGYNVSDVDQSVFPEYNWPMYVQSDDGEEHPIPLNPGDMIIYRGCEVDHWRDKFIGKNHAQVFMHYNDSSGLFKQLYDNRPILGIPKSKY